MATVELKGITKTYSGNDVPSVDDLNVRIEDGEFVVLVGPSGCGKSTALRMVAGLESISGGDLFIDEERVNDVAPQQRDIAMVFQNYALYPHMTVAKNMGYPLKVSGLSKDEIARRVKETAEVLQLDEFLDRKPGNLSGGQRQRVAMGRALIRQPKVFLMDEPLSNLDAKLRVYMRSEIAAIQERLGITTIYVTHDQVEAMTMGDRVVVLKDGVLQQADTPKELYDHPANMFVAGFIGSPAMNLFESRLEGDGASLRIVVGEQSVGLPDSVVAARPALASHVGQRIIAGVRPDDCYDAKLSSEYPVRLNARVLLLESLGSEIVAHLDVGVGLVDSGDPDLQELSGDAADAPTAFLARFSPHSRVEKGEDIAMAVDADKLHFFDPASGLAIRG
ncbi:MAG: sn-glycerol-3-phosphate ABC transporter ATP-binding protein UgpC [Actinomycetota bacterium]